MNGHFVIQRSLHKFPLIWKDQSHEQSNKNLQSNVGISDLYTPDARTLHMLSAPDSARIVDEFENILASRDQSTAHHEEAPSLKIKFIDVKSLADFLRKRGNLFCGTSSQLTWN